MGYRSNASVLFYTRKQSAVSFPALKLWFDENYPIQDAKHDWDAKITYGSDYVLVEYEDVKWWSGANHVKRVEALFDLFADTFDTEETDNAAYEFARTGEQVDDIEEQRSAYADYRLGVSRQIVFY